jgi:hypothetical protein
MEPGSKNKKQKPYVPPTLTKLTAEQAKKLVAERTHRNDQEAAEFLESRRQEKPRQKEEKYRPNDCEGKSASALPRRRLPEQIH